MSFTVSTEQLVKTFTTGSNDDLTAVDEVSLSVPAGDVVALTGPSGSGKSTLLHLIGAIEAATSGTVTVGGTVVTSARRTELAAYRHTVGFVFQRFHLLPALTALDNVLAPMVPYGRRHRDATRTRAMDLLQAVGLAGRESSLPSQMSGGQQQRVAIARALIAEPGLLLADEPTGNLDTANGEEIIKLLLSLNADHHTTMLIATHDQSVATRCNRTINMRDGRMVTDQTL